jgi:SAM-dependent methyltransferase
MLFKAESVIPWRIRRAGVAFCLSSSTGTGLDELFRYSDEADVLRAACRDAGLFDAVSAMVDPFCGVGHLTLSVPARLAVMGADISPRAIRFATLNARLNCRRRATFVEGDVRSPTLWQRFREFDRCPLIAANPPFGPVPHARRSPHHSAAGWWGDAQVRATLAMRRRFLPEAPVALLGLAFIGASGRNSLLERTSTMTAGRSSWLHRPGERFWRLGDRRELRSPAALGDVARVSAAHSGWGTAAEWDRWATAKEREGFEQVEYGVLVVA